MHEVIAEQRATELLRDALQERLDASRRTFEPHARRLALLCHAMAERFARGGRLLAFASSPAACSDARHVAVEFVHPVIVGKRALPALALTGEDLTREARLHTRAEDIAMAFGTETDGGAGAEALAGAAAAGALTIAFSGAGAEWELDPASADPYIRQEVIETAYHVLWELVHVFFEHRGLLSDRSERRAHDAGRSSFLYPFLAEAEDRLEPVVADVARSVVMKSEEIGGLRGQTLIENADALVAASCALRAALEAGGRLLAIGNGGSATDAMDLVADARGSGRSWPALDLTEDPAIITAIANDIGPDAIFSRQVIAHGREGDVLVVLSTSGSSRNVIEALVEARGRGVATIAFVGYDGGRIAAEELADHVVVTRSEHIPRIQEAQASAYHCLLDLMAAA